MTANSLDLKFGSRDDLATQICTLYDEWRDRRSEVEARWTEVRKYKYATSTKETSNDGIGGFSEDPDARQGWSHSTVIPKITNISDNLSAQYMMGMFSREKWVSWQGFDKESATYRTRQVLEAYVLTKARLRGFRNEIQKCIDDWIETGNMFGYVEYAKETHIDPVTKKPYVAYEGPVFYRISPYDIVFNPLATSFEKTPKIIISIKSVGELIREAEECPGLRYNLEVLEKVKDLRKDISVKNERYINKYDHLAAAGYGNATDYLKSGNVEILDFYGDIYNPVDGKLYKNHVITVVDRTYVVRLEPIKSLTGSPYIFHCGWRTRSESLWGMGPLENLLGMQYMINHLQNTKADAFDEFVVPSVFTAGDVEIHGEKYGGLLGQHYHSDSADGQVVFLRPDASFLQADLQIQYLEAMMEAYAGSPREAMGIRTPGEKTAFEIDHLANMAARTFYNKLNYADVVFIEPIANAFVEVGKLNLSSKDIVHVTDDDYGAVEFAEISVSDLRSYGKMIPMGSRHFSEKARAAQTLATMQTVLTDMDRLHISSIDVAKAFIESGDLQTILPVTPYIRIREQATAEQAAMMLQDQNTLEVTGPRVDGSTTV